MNSAQMIRLSRHNALAVRVIDSDFRVQAGATCQVHPRRPHLRLVAHDHLQVRRRRQTTVRVQMAHLRSLFRLALALRHTVQAAAWPPACTGGPRPAEARRCLVEQRPHPRLVTRHEQQAAEVELRDQVSVCLVPSSTVWPSIISR